MVVLMGGMKHWDGEDATDSPRPEKYFDLGLVPPRTLAPVESFYSLLLDQPARKPCFLNGKVVRRGNWSRRSTGESQQI